MIFTIGIIILLCFGMILNLFVQTNLMAPLDLFIGISLMVRALLLPRFNPDLHKAMAGYGGAILVMISLLLLDRSDIVGSSLVIPETVVFTIAYLVTILLGFGGTGLVLRAPTYNFHQERLKDSIFALGLLMLGISLFYNPFDPYLVPIQGGYLYLQLLAPIAGQLVVIIGYAHITWAIEDYWGQVREDVPSSQLLYRTKQLN